MPKRKAATQEPDEEAASDEEEKKDTIDDNGSKKPPAVAPSTPARPLTSPPGMRLRSGRKKRRRSSGDGKEQAAKRHAKKGAAKRAAKDDEEEDVVMNGDKKTDWSSDESDDESMESGEEDEVTEDENGHGKPPAVAQLPQNEAPPARALEPIAKLRMPSKHTPGKLQTTAPAAAAAPPPASRRLQFEKPAASPGGVLNQLPPRPDAAAEERQEAQQKEQQQQQQELPSPPGMTNAQLTDMLGTVQEQQQESLSWFQSAFSAARSLQETAATWLTPAAVADEDGVEVQESSNFWKRPPVWFILLLFVQLVLWNPIHNTLQDTSDRSLQFYQSLFARPTKISVEEVPKEEEPVEVEEPELVEEDDDDDEAFQEMEEIAQLLESLENSDSTTASQLKSAEKQLKLVKGKLRERRMALQDWMDGLKDVEPSLQALVDADFKSDSAVLQQYIRADELLDFFTKMVPPEIKTILLDVSNVPQWSINAVPPEQPEQDCPDVQSLVKDERDALLTMEKMAPTIQDLQAVADSETTRFMTTTDAAETVRSWTRDGLMHSDNTVAAEQEAVASSGLAEEDVRDIIRASLAVEMADQTGKIDHASLSSGATVIRSGPRATTPSISESLPLLNRVMAQVGLRFYGFHAEIALTPTSDLYQCWAFEKSTRRVDDSCGKFGTLSIRLNQPTQVTSVAIQHVPKEITDEWQSAIREFRIIGYEDPDAAGTPLPMGSFRYNVDAPRNLQHFDVATTLDDEPMPKIQSITLAIDSNWDHSYSCLYRFRVHDDEQVVSISSSVVPDEQDDKLSEEFLEDYEQDDFSDEYDDSESVHGDGQDDFSDEQDDSASVQDGDYVENDEQENDGSEPDGGDDTESMPGSEEDANVQEDGDIDEPENDVGEPDVGDDTESVDDDGHDEHDQDEGSEDEDRGSEDDDRGSEDDDRGSEDDDRGSEDDDEDSSDDPAAEGYHPKW